MCFCPSFCGSGNFAGRPVGFLSFRFSLIWGCGPSVSSLSWARFTTAFYPPTRSLLFPPAGTGFSCSARLVCFFSCIFCLFAFFPSLPCRNCAKPAWSGGVRHENIRRDGKLRFQGGFHGGRYRFKTAWFSKH